ncbi:MAG TPA: SDR family oxidoreductase [Burkholderiales bacterium]|nr:SDR family oxidoreductase [Burkholderiales bacterium]
MPIKVVITGATSGIGEALAREYAKQGATLGLIARRERVLAQLKDSLSTTCLTYAADVRDAHAMQQAAADFLKRQGCPDVAIANAGISHGTLTEYAQDLESFEAILDTNVMGMLKTFHPFLAAMCARKQGTLVGVSSISGFRGLPGAGAYSASKAAAISYLESLRVELRDSGVNVLTVCPGYIATPMTANNPYPMPFIISAEEAARKIIRAIEQNRKFLIIPWQMALLGRIFRLLPLGLYDRVLAKMPRKPRDV